MDVVLAVHITYWQDYNKFVKIQSVSVGNFNDKPWAVADLESLKGGCSVVSWIGVTLPHQLILVIIK